MIPDPLDELGARLFDAARDEAPPARAVERAIAAAQRARSDASSGSSSSRRMRVTLWLAAAALAAGAVFFARSGRESRTRISAEPASSMTRNRAPQPPSYS